MLRCRRPSHHRRAAAHHYQQTKTIVTYDRRVLLFTETKGCLDLFKYVDVIQMTISIRYSLQVAKSKAYTMFYTGHAIRETRQNCRKNKGQVLVNLEILRDSKSNLRFFWHSISANIYLNMQSLW